MIGAEADLVAAVNENECRPGVTVGFVSEEENTIVDSARVGNFGGGGSGFRCSNILAAVLIFLAIVSASSVE
jgi:hypothetical protein